MHARSRGVYAVDWAETEIDGWRGAAVRALAVGATWSWSGREVRLDGAQDILRLVTPADGVPGLAARAARRATRTVGAGSARARPAAGDGADAAPDAESFTVTDGRREFRLDIVRDARARRILVVLPDAPPPARTGLWVSARHFMSGEATGQGVRESAGDWAGLADGSRVLTPEGARPVEDLRAGDLVLTRDEGAQPLVSVGAVRIGAARVQVAPWLAPVRVRAGAGLHEFMPGASEGAGNLLVAPRQRLLLSGPGVAALFRTGEVLARACDLVDDLADNLAGGRSVASVRLSREVTCRLLVFVRPQIVWANGVPCESSRPGGPSAPDGDDVSVSPGAAPPARPHIGRGEAAIVRYARRLAPRQVEPGAQPDFPRVAASGASPLHGVGARLLTRGAGAL